MLSFISCEMFARVQLAQSTRYAFGEWTNETGARVFSDTLALPRVNLLDNAALLAPSISIASDINVLRFWEPLPVCYGLESIRFETICTTSFNEASPKIALWIS